MGKQTRELFALHNIPPGSDCPIKTMTHYCCKSGHSGRLGRLEPFCLSEEHITGPRCTNPQPFASPKLGFHPRISLYRNNTSYNFLFQAEFDVDWHSRRRSAVVSSIPVRHIMCFVRLSSNEGILLAVEYIGAYTFQLSLIFVT
jgi:hypothetical protein